MVGTDFAVAVEHDVAVARESGTAVVQQYGILPIADDPDFRHVGNGVVVAGIALCLHLRVLVAFVLRHLQIYVWLHLCLLLQQGLHAAHRRFMHEIVLQTVVGQIVRQAGQNHTLVVGVVSLHCHMVLLVIAFEKAETAQGALHAVRRGVHAQSLEPLQVIIHSSVVYSYCHQRAVRRDDYAVGSGVLELEVGYTKGVIFIVLCVIQLVVGRLRNTPRQLYFAPFHLFGKCLLCTYGKTVGLVHKGVLVCGQEDERHEVFKQCAVPRGDALVALVLHKSLVKAEPVLVWGIALCNGHEAGQSCFGSKVVVVVG